MRQMIDTTHDGFPSTLPVIQALSPGDGVALYDTGSPSIMATPGDIAQVPRGLFIAMIDQGFTDSPNLNAKVRDCENGAWQLSNAVDKTGWDVPRPTLYLGFPYNAIQAFNLGWRGDVWLVAPSSHAPASPPVVPNGLTVVAVQWQFAGAWDRSVVFDPTWPAVPTPPPPPVRKKKVYLIHIATRPEVFLWNGTSMSHVSNVTEEMEWVKAGVPSVTISEVGFSDLTGAPVLP